jgi:hypothetical protein
LLDVDAVFAVLEVGLHPRLGFGGVDHDAVSAAAALGGLRGLGTVEREAGVPVGGGAGVFGEPIGGTVLAGEALADLGRNFTGG